MREIQGSDTVLYRLVAHNPAIEWDFLSQAARKQPPPRRNPPSEHDWAGLSMFTSYEAVRKLGVLFDWKHGEWVAVLLIPHGAPFTIEGPDRKGHVMLYDSRGNMIEGEVAGVLAGLVVQIVHGPSVESFAL
jgi:hypothetical protein